MAGNIYIGDTPLIKLNSGIDLTGYSTLEIKWQAPDESTGTVTASQVDATYAQYQVSNVDFLNQAGLWKFIIHAILPSWQGHGEPHKEIIYELFEP